jgi:hypothetical protein
VPPAFGVADDELKTMIRGELLDYSDEFARLLKLGYTWLSQVKNSNQTPLLSVLLEGDVGTGKTALAAKLALDSGFPFTKVISPEMYVGFSENAKCTAIAKVLFVVVLPAGLFVGRCSPPCGVALLGSDFRGRLQVSSVADCAGQH